MPGNRSLVRRAPRMPAGLTRSLIAGWIVGVLLAASAPVAAAHGPGDGLGSRLPDTTITDWDATGTAAFTAAALTPAEGHVIFAYVAIAEYDAVMAIKKHAYRPFAIRVPAPSGASPQAAVAAAAHAILAHYLPGQAATIIDPALVTSLAAIPDGEAKTDGIAVGEAVAAALIAQRADDGFRASYPYTRPDPPIPGVWIPTASTPPIGAYLPYMRPFALKSADQFRPDGPPSLLSRRWARDYNEVKEIGSRTSTTRTAEQTIAARFWAEPPVQQARGSFRKFILDHELGIVQAARFNAMVSVSYADALIACFDAKYAYALWRPITAIPAGDTDGNPATVGDPAWLPLLAATPNHPEYPSAHSCITPIGGIVAERVLHTREIDFTVPSLSGLGDRTFATVQALSRDVADGRVYGGIHYRSAVKDGVTIAHEVADYVLDRNFRRAGH